MTAPGGTGTVCGVQGRTVTAATGRRPLGVSTPTGSTGGRASDEPRLSTTLVMSLAAVAAALIAIFGDREAFSGLTVAFALTGLLPWALEAGGVRLHPLAFLSMTMVPAGVVVLIDRNPGGMFPVMLTVVSMTRRNCSPWLTGLCIAGAAGLTVGLAVLEGTVDETGTVYFLGGVGVSWLAGSMLHRQEVLVREVREAADRERRHAAAEERTRIAREIHDVVAHSLTVTMLHVTGARRTLTHDPERAAEALERAETVGRESLDSIRQVVGLLRAHDPSARSVDGDDAPLPELADIPALVDQFRGAGLRVAAELELDGVAADAATSLTAFRVVQEALSNVLQHSPGAPVELSVTEDGHGTVLRIVAENPAVATTCARGGRREGLGLLGMTERVRAAGGSVEVGATERDTWRIEAALPLRRSAALS